MWPYEDVELQKSAFERSFANEERIEDTRRTSLAFKENELYHSTTSVQLENTYGLYTDLDNGYDEARYNLATRVMSNGVEVIIASDKNKTNDKQNPQPHKSGPHTLAPSTLKNQMKLTVPYEVQNGRTSVESREKVVSNIATEERNYLRVSTGLLQGVTLSSTPELMVGVFPTTYRYYNTILNDDEELMVISSSYTITNTVTGPDDYISFLQPSEGATPLLDTNTYYSRFTYTKAYGVADNDKIATTDQVLTQVIVTESMPSHGTDSSYDKQQAFDKSSLGVAAPIDASTFSSHNSLVTPTNFSQMNSDETPELNDVHIFATKTFLTTFTYYTTTLSTQKAPNRIEGDAQTSHQGSDIKKMNSTPLISYQTRIIENVVTDTIASSLLKPELVAKFRKELMQKKGKNQRRVIVTMATLLGGQTLEITAMKIMKSTKNSAVPTNVGTIKHTKPSQPQTSVSSTAQTISPTTKLTPSSIAADNSEAVAVADAGTGTDDSNTAGSESSSVYVRPPFQLSKVVPQLPAAVDNLIGSFQLQKLRPMLNAMAGLLQTNLLAGNQSKPSTFVHQAKRPQSDTAALIDTKLNGSKLTIGKAPLTAERPIYIPVQNGLANRSNYTSDAFPEYGQSDVESKSPTMHSAHSLHIEPPDADVPELSTDEDNLLQYSSNNMTISPQTYQVPLLNRGIPIRPGEVITTNSDVIIGRPNGIQFPRIPLTQTPSQAGSNLFDYRINKQDQQQPIANGATYYSHYITHPLKKKSSPSKIPSIIPLIAPRPSVGVISQPKKPTNAMQRRPENYDGILQPPPPPPPSNQMYYQAPPVTAAPAVFRQQNDRTQAQVNDYKNLNDELKYNEIIEIKRIPEIFLMNLSQVKPQNQDNTQFIENTQKNRQNTNGTDHNVYSAHQRINLKTDVLSHNVAINVPPLTFKKESDDYPQQATAIHGQIPFDVSRDGVSATLMPQVKIPHNQAQVQVRLTPQTVVGTIAASPGSPQNPFSYFHHVGSHFQLSPFSQPHDKHLNSADQTVMGAFPVEWEENSGNHQLPKTIESHLPPVPTPQVFTVPNYSYQQETSKTLYMRPPVAIEPELRAPSKPTPDFRKLSKTVSSSYPTFYTSQHSQQTINSKRLRPTEPSATTTLETSNENDTSEQQLDQNTSFSTHKLHLSNFSRPTVSNANKSEQPTDNLPNKNMNRFPIPTIRDTKQDLYVPSTTPRYPSSTHTTLEENLNITKHPVGRPFTLQETKAINTKLVRNPQPPPPPPKSVFISSGEMFKVRPTAASNGLLLKPNTTLKLTTTSKPYPYDVSNEVLVPPFAPVHVPPLGPLLAPVYANKTIHKVNVLGLNPPPPPPALVTRTPQTFYSTINYAPIQPPTTTKSKPLQVEDSQSFEKSKTDQKNNVTLKKVSETLSPPLPAATQSKHSTSITSSKPKAITTRPIHSTIVRSSKIPVKSTVLRTDASSSTILQTKINDVEIKSSSPSSALPIYVNDLTSTLDSSEVSVREVVKTTIYVTTSSLPTQPSVTLAPPTKYITNTKVRTVTATKTMVIPRQDLDWQRSSTQIGKISETPRTTTLLITKTQTILNRITEIHTSTLVLQSISTISPATLISSFTTEQSYETNPDLITISQTSSTDKYLEPSIQYDIYLSNHKAYENQPSQTQQTVTHSKPSEAFDYKNDNFEFGEDPYEAYPSIEIVLTDNQLNRKQQLDQVRDQEHKVLKTKFKPDTQSAHNQSSIFIVMSNDRDSSKIATDDNSAANGEPNQTIGIPLDYDSNTSLDYPTHDDEFTAADVNSGKHVLLGGVLLTTPPKVNSNYADILDFGFGESPVCQPACKSTRNEVCAEIGSRTHCICRPGFARMFPDRPCKPTYTYEMRIPTQQIGNYYLQYNKQLMNNASNEFRHLSSVMLDAVDRMVMQSDFRDVYHGVKLRNFGTEQGSQGVVADFLLQLSDNSDEKRLENVFKKYLRLSNYSVGGTELYTSKQGLQYLTIKDFDECANQKYHDCSPYAFCFNLQGTYTCSCRNGYVDLTENPIYPGRICSGEIIGCEKCHYHGNCISDPLAKSTADVVCECFAWYSGSTCQLNLKILLISLIAVGTVLFMLLLFCVLLTYTKRRRYQHSSGNSQIFVSSSLHPSLVSTTTLKKAIRQPASAKKTSTSGYNKNSNIDKHAMIKDTSSESSHDSLPYALKESSKNSKQFASTYKSSANSNIRRLKVKSSMYDTLPSAEHEQVAKGNVEQLLLHSHTAAEINEGATSGGMSYTEQTDRSLTVMIPRAKYQHLSVLPPNTQLLHHQLTLEKPEKPIRNECTTSTPNAQPKNSTKKKLSNIQPNYTTPPGALVSAGFEVSAMVSDNAATLISLSTFDTPTNDEFRRQRETKSSSSTSNENSTSNDHFERYVIEKSRTTQRENSENKQSTSEQSNTMTDWLDSIHKSTLATEARSFDETTVEAPTKTLMLNYESQIYNSNDEANTMAERDLGSTFLLPHTHLYKPEKESEISGFDSL